MAYVIKKEQNLANWINSLTRESELLRVIMIVEAVIALLLIISGVIFFFWKGNTNILILACVAAFFTIGHWYKIYENSRNAKFVKRGRAGEIKVSDKLEKYLDDNCFIINDVDLRFGKQKSQIDHIVVAPNGIFIIETKNWAGHLEGNETDDRWNQTKEVKGKSIQVKLKSPIVQNARHVETARMILDNSKVDWEDIFSIVVISSRNTALDIDSTTPVVYGDELVELIKWTKSTRDYSEEEISKVIEILFPNCLISK